MSVRRSASMRWAFLILVSVLFTVFFSFGIGATSAFAEETGNLPAQAAQPAASSSDVTTQDASHAPASSETAITAAPTATATAPASSPDAAAVPSSTSAQQSATDTASDSDPVVMSAADVTYPGDDGSASMFIAIQPEPLTYYTSIDPAYNPDPVINPDGPYTVDSNGITQVYVVGDVGKAVSLASRIDYTRFGENEYYASSSVNLPGESGNNYVMMSYYYDKPPLPQGTYTSSTDPTTVVPNDGTTSTYPVSALSFVSEYASTFPLSRLTWSSDSNLTALNLPYAYRLDGMNHDVLLLRGPINPTIYAQATYVQVIETPGKDADGQDITIKTYKLCASNVIAFSLFGRPAPSATVRVNIVDEAGMPIGGSASFGSQVMATVSDMDGRYFQVPWNAYADSTSITIDQVFTGQYTVNVYSPTGEYESVMEDFFISGEEIVQANNSNTPIVRSITMRAIVPNQYTVSFVAEDGVTILLAPRQYNEGTASYLVERPATNPVKADDEDYSYVFENWMTLDGRKGIQAVYSDATYKPTFRSIPKKNVVATATIHAAGGLFSEPKPAGVASYGLEESTPSQARQDELKQSYASDIGENTVIGMFEVNLKQYNDDGTVKDISEGIGHLSLSFNVPGVADGTKLKVLQLHKRVSDGIYELITHTGVVADGKITITLDGRLSTFIITAEPAEEPTPVVPDPVTYTVTFQNEDGSVISSNAYNEGTSGSNVTMPADPKKADDATSTYIFSGWQITRDGQTSVTRTAYDVTADMTYKATFTAIPNKDVKSDEVNKVYAEGGIFDEQKSGVASYELVVSTPADTDQTAIKEQNTSVIGSNTVSGVYTVELVQHSSDGTTAKLSEGIGNMSLTLPVDAEDGAKVKVIQLHEGASGTQTIEHTGLVAMNKSVTFNLGGKLSNFIVTLEQETASDPASGTTDTSGTDSGSSATGGSTSGTDSGSSATGGSASGTDSGSSATGGSASGTSETSSSTPSTDSTSNGTANASADESSSSQNASAATNASSSASSTQNASAAATSAESAISAPASTTVATAAAAKIPMAKTGDAPEKASVGVETGDGQTILVLTLVLLAAFVGITLTATRRKVEE